MPHQDTLQLTDDETQLVLAHRAKKEAEAYRMEFVQRALTQASQFNAWSNQKREGLTFSTFVNTYGYEASDARPMYEAVSTILEAINSFAIPVNKS